MGFFDFLKTDKATTEHQPLYFHNSLTGKKEEFHSLSGRHVTMYSCGPTVYDHIHIGNLRAYLLPDLIKRVLIMNRYDVEHTINFTDFGHLSDDGDNGEDKMLRALKRENKPVTLDAMKEVAGIYIRSFKEDLDAFHVIPPTHYTPASEYVSDQIRLIKTLYEKGYAYETRDGVYFDIAKFPTYGQIGNVDIAKLKEGARVEVNEEKHHPADFALWKKSLLGWESDWGKGFPGWHIECTAMCFATLGKQIDIHTGGEDLKYTHHNGEIAQAESITGKPYVKYWLHNAHLGIDGTKIAKSLGNGIRLRGLMDRGIPPLAYRYWLLTGHYRTMMNFTFESVEASKQALFRMKRFVFEEAKNKAGTPSEVYMERFQKALNDDLDTPKAIALMWEVMKDTSLTNEEKVGTLKEMDAVLDIGLGDDPSEVTRELGIVAHEELPSEVQELLDARELSRSIHNWDESDRLREAINLKGYVVEDTPQGQRISRALSS